MQHTFFNKLKTRLCTQDSGLRNSGTQDSVTQGLRTQDLGTQGLRTLDFGLRI